MLDKSTLRQTMLQQRQQLSDAKRDEYSKAWAVKATKFLTKQNYQTIAGYYLFRGELNILPLLEELREQGKTVLLPRTPETSAPLSFHHYHADHLENGKYGIQQPVANSPIQLPGVILVPLVACDVTGNRLGYGGGYYDRTLASFADHPLTIGCAYDLQLVETLPHETHDQKLDIIITPSTVIDCRLKPDSLDS